MEGRYRVEQLGRQHDRAAFESGEEALDRYFQRQVGQDQRRDLAVPYVLVDTATREIAGYYTLSTLSIVPTDVPDALARKLPHYAAVPAILLGRLAVDLRYRGQGLGKLLLIDALIRSRSISRQFGAMAVVVDAKNDRARSFYEQYGFKRFVDEEYRLFLPMATIAQLETDHGPEGL
jgi:GNAT superfamily N-acetyltransferase